jgi:transketolase
VNGHDFMALNQAFLQAQAVFEKPSVIIAHTIPGKGVNNFERDYTWHGKPPSKEEGAQALKELRTLGGKIKSEHQ